MRAVETKVMSESISKVLYPGDEMETGKELRLKQQYFFVAATLRDILLEYKEDHQSFPGFSNWAAIQINDTHLAITIPELMRLFMDEERLDWEESWSICEKTFAYTNHTVLPEALETWPVGLLSKILPRHMEIIYEINQRFLDTFKKRYPDEPGLLASLSIIQEGAVQQVQMAHLAISGSHCVNGVAALHSTILKINLFKDFNRIYPGRIKNITNGITPETMALSMQPRSFEEGKFDKSDAMTHQLGLDPTKVKLTYGGAIDWAANSCEIQQ